MVHILSDVTFMPKYAKNINALSHYEVLKNTKMVIFPAFWLAFGIGLAFGNGNITISCTLHLALPVEYRSEFPLEMQIQGFGRMTTMFVQKFHMWLMNQDQKKNLQYGSKFRYARR